jgi:hypothetical protein
LSRNLDKNVFIAKKPSVKQELPVRKKTLITAALVSAFLFSAVAVTQSNFLAKANFVFPPSNPRITMVSPTNTTYNTNNLSLQVTFETYHTGYEGGPDYGTSRLFTYALDGKNPENITITNASVVRIPGSNVFFEGSMRLPELTEGLHNLTVRVVFDYPPPGWDEPYSFHTESVSTVYFRIDTVPQHISVLTPENKTYMLIVPLQFSINEPASWIGYSLDGQANVTVTGNTNLLGLSVGKHTLTLYSNDASGNPVASETITFTVADAVPIVLFVASCLAVGVVGVLLYFKKRKH